MRGDLFGYKHGVTDSTNYSEQNDQASLIKT